MSEHLDESTWEKLAMRELDPALRATALSHVTSCRRCAETWKALLALDHGARAFDPGLAPVARPSLRWHRIAGIGLAAAALIAVVILWTRRPGDQVLRGPETALEVLRPSGDVAGPVEFDWRPVTGADRYRLELFSEGGEIVWTAVVDRAPRRVPGELDVSRARFARVTALANDRPIATSRLIAITIR